MLYTIVFLIALSFFVTLVQLTLVIIKALKATWLDLTVVLANMQSK